MKKDAEKTDRYNKYSILDSEFGSAITNLLASVSTFISSLKWIVPLYIILNAIVDAISSISGKNTLLEMKSFLFADINVKTDNEIAFTISMKLFAVIILFLILTIIVSAICYVLENRQKKEALARLGLLTKKVESQEWKRRSSSKLKF